MVHIELVSFGRGDVPSEAASAAAAGLQLTRPEWSVAHTVLPGTAGGPAWRRMLLEALRRHADAHQRPWWVGRALDLLRAPLIDGLAGRFAARKPDLVVSMLPLLNATIAEAILRAARGATLVTVVDDPEDQAPHGWIERGQRQHFVCYTERVAEQCLDAGHSARYVHRMPEPLLDLSACTAAEEAVDLRLDVAIVLGRDGKRQRRELTAALAGLRVAAEHPGPRALQAIASARVAVVQPDARVVAACARLGVPALIIPAAMPAPTESFAAHWASDLGWARVVHEPKRVRQEVDRVLAHSSRLARPTPNGALVAPGLGPLLDGILVMESGGNLPEDYRPPPGWGGAKAAEPATQAQACPSITAYETTSAPTADCATSSWIG